MKSILLFLVSFLFLCVAVFVSPQKVMGAILTSNTTTTLGNSTAVDTLDWSGGVQRDYQGFKLNADGTVTDVSVDVVDSSCNQSGAIGIVARIVSATSSPIDSVTLASSSMVAQSSWPCPGGGQNAFSTFTFPVAPELTAGVQYFLTLEASPNLSDSLAAYVIGPYSFTDVPNHFMDTYADGFVVSEANGGSQTNYTGRDMFFYVLGDEASNAISIIKPQDGQVSSTASFNIDTWRVNYSEAGSGLTCRVRMYYSATSSYFSDLQYDSSPFVPCGSQSALFDWSKNIALGEGTWYFQARLYASSGVQVATSSVVDVALSINPSQFGTPSSSATSSNWTLSCDAGNWTDSICNVFAFLFVPSQESMNSFGNLENEVQAKFPFAYFYDVQDIVDGQNTTSTETNFPSLMISTASSAIPVSIAMFSSTTVTTYAGASLINTFRNMFVYALWLAFASMIYFEIKYLI